MINRKVDILPPMVKLWGEPDNISYDGINPDSIVYRISFNLDVEGLIESEIMQIFTKEMVNDIAAAMMADKATVAIARFLQKSSRHRPHRSLNRLRLLLRPLSLNRSRKLSLSHNRKSHRSRHRNRSSRLLKSVSLRSKRSMVMHRSKETILTC